MWTLLGLQSKEAPAQQRHAFTPEFCSMWKTAIAVRARRAISNITKQAKVDMARSCHTHASAPFNTAENKKMYKTCTTSCLHFGLN
jgi:hypothetical protein